MFHQLRLAFLSACRCTILAAFALAIGPGTDVPAVELPEPAIPGLRYYEPSAKVEPRTVDADVCIYGGCSAGVMAAVQADRMGKRVVLLEFGRHLGGLSSGGLSETDGGDPAVCSGIAREFYDLIGRKNFRPSQAEAAFETLLAGTKVEVHKLAHLATVEKDGPRIVAITMEDGLTVRARQFIDATYEGDLLARAGVSWHAGREATTVYGETLNGIRTPGQGGHDWPVAIDPYRRPGDPASGLLPRVNLDPGWPRDGDERIQAFCFRMWLTRKNPLPFPKPAGYDETEYELLARLFESGLHHCQMTVVDGAVRNEGNVEVGVEPYPIAYRALVPKRGECTNLLVPVALSSSHIAFGSIRMEPVFMLLGQAAATAAALAIDGGVAVQDLPYDTLRRRLLADGQILEYRGPPRQPAGRPRPAEHRADRGG